MSVTEINTIKDAVIEVAACVFALGFCLWFALALNGAFDKE